MIQPYAVTQLTIEAVFRTLSPDHVAAARTQVAAVIGERQRLSAALIAHRSVLRVWPSAANFLLVEFADPADVLERTHAAGLLLRDLRSAPTLGQALRISIGTAAENDRLVASLP